MPLPCAKSVRIHSYSGPHSDWIRRDTWSAFSHIRTEEILHISPYSVRVRANTDQNNSEYGHFSRSVNKGRKQRIIDLMFVWLKISTSNYWFKTIWNPSVLQKVTLLLTSLLPITLSVEFIKYITIHRSNHISYFLGFPPQNKLPHPFSFLTY